MSHGVTSVVSGSPAPAWPALCAACSIDHWRTRSDRCPGSVRPPASLFSRWLALESSSGRARLWLSAASGAGSPVTSVPRSSQVRTETDRDSVTIPSRDLRSDAHRVDWQHSVTHRVQTETREQTKCRKKSFSSSGMITTRASLQLWRIFAAPSSSAM